MTLGLGVEIGSFCGRPGLVDFCCHPNKPPNRNAQKLDSFPARDTIAMSCAMRHHGPPPIVTLRVDEKPLFCKCALLEDKDFRTAVARIKHPPRDPGNVLP